jgi:UDP-3-O-[3-hydroxymyristoyl] glucosamine N-acyltransferase
VKLKELAKLIGGEVAGNGELVIKRVATLEGAGSGDLVFLLDDKLLPQALKSGAAAILASAKFKGQGKGKSLLLAKNPRLAMAQLLPLFSPKPKTKPGVHPTAVVAKSAKLGLRVTIYPFVYVGEDCEIGDDTIVYPSATLYDRVKVGKRVVIHAGARIGVDGYGFVQQEGKHVKIPQLGSVIIGDDVEIFANVCISRGTIGPTVIGSGTKIDSLTHVAHNCEIGQDCAVVSLVGFAGSVKLGNRVYVAGQAGFNGHIAIGDNTIIMARAGVTKDIPANAVVSGFPAQDHRREMEYQAALRRLAKKAK